MKSWCLIDHLTGHVFKICFTEEQLKEYLVDNPDVTECIDCIECDDAPSICIE